MNVVELRAVSKSWRRGSLETVGLSDVSLRVNEGESVALMGPSGCGKSTTLHLVAGVESPDRGDVLVCGQSIAHGHQSELVHLRRRVIGMVFQSFELMSNLTVEENIALPLALAGQSDAQRVNELLERVGLLARRDHFPSELSGGEQQRTAIARALVHRPKVLLADEPTGNLDSVSSAEVLQLLRDLQRESGTALLLATHDARVAQMSDRVIELKDGRVAASS